VVCRVAMCLSGVVSRVDLYVVLCVICVVWCGVCCLECGVFIFVLCLSCLVL